MKLILSLLFLGLSAHIIQINAGAVKMDPKCLDAFRVKSIETSNFYRVKHKVGKLTKTKDKIIKIAQDYACHLAANFKFDHNKEATKTLGENLYMFSTTAKIPSTLADCEKYGQRSVESWYSEVKSYNFANGKSKDGDVVGHFTQLVWKESKRVGSGLCFSDKKDKKGFYWVVVVANYDPPGNIIGDYTNNVFPSESAVPAAGAKKPTDNKQEKQTERPKRSTPRNNVTSSKRKRKSSASTNNYNFFLYFASIIFMFSILF